MQFLIIKKGVRLVKMSNKKLDEKFEVFYKFRFDKDFLKNNTDKQIYKKKESLIWFKKNYKKKLLLTIKFNAKIVGLIIYNLDNFYYSIIIEKKFRGKKIGIVAITKFIELLKKRKLKLKTLVKKNNTKSVYLHEKISRAKKDYNKNYYLFTII